MSGRMQWIVWLPHAPVTHFLSCFIIASSSHTAIVRPIFRTMPPSTDHASNGQSQKVQFQLNTSTLEPEGSSESAAYPPALSDNATRAPA